MRFHIVLRLSLFFFLISYDQKAQHGEGDKHIIDSLNKVIAAEKIDSLKAKALIGLAWEIKYKQPQKAKELCLEGIKLNAGSKQLAITAMAYKVLGILEDGFGNYSESINHYLKAIQFYNKIADSMGIARTECNIGMLYRKIDQPKEAVPYFRRSLPFFERKHFVMGMNLSNQNLGIVYFDLKQTDSALHYFLCALKVLDANHAEDPGLFGNISNCYGRKKETVKQEMYLNKCIKAFENKSDSTSSYFFWIHNLGNFYRDNGKKKKGIELVRRGVSGFERLGIIKSEQGINLLRNLAITEAEDGNYKEAYNAIAKAMRFNDQVNNADVITQMTEQKEKYEADKKELSISNLEKEKKLQNSEIKHQATQKYALGAGLLLTIGMMFLLYKNIAQKKKDNLIIQKQKDLVDQKNKEVEDSIIYAKRLQDAILPPVELISTYFPDSYVVYLPKDIIAGDFFWMEVVQLDGSGMNQYQYAGMHGNSQIFKAEKLNILLAVADCTGHGVPGAMVSVICSTALNRSVKEFALTEPGEILGKTRELVIETFEKGGANVKDGMDISLLSIEMPFSMIIEGNTKMKWAGANNPLWYTKNGSMVEVTANKQPIGKVENQKPFTTHSFELEKGEQVYLFSDGYADQFGGNKGKKFKYKQLGELFVSNANLKMPEQKNSLLGKFNDWRGQLEQVDDVCVITIRM
jgi:serine phosphatase RsbU (regulator of sigma subunit)